MAINIMITDDHSMIREGLKNLLELDGDIKVIAEAENGEDCLEKLKTVTPDVLLLDEAFSALDYQTRLSVADDVFKIIKSENITTIMVTHDIPESISMSDDVIVLTKRPTYIRSVHPIHFDMENRTPLTCRDNPSFSKYFDIIWKELNSDG